MSAEGTCTSAELVARAGIDHEHFDRMISLGILEPLPDGTFKESDLSVVKLCEAFEDGGISLDAISKAIREGHFSFAFAEFVFRDELALSDRTFEEACREADADPEYVRQVFTAAGLPAPGLEDRIRVRDVERLIDIVTPRRIGSGDPAQIMRAVRIYGESLHRVAEAESHVYHMLLEEPLLRSGMSERQMRETIAEVSPVLGDIAERVMVWIYRRHQEHAIVEHLLGHLYDLMDRTGLEERVDHHPPAICFLDLAGYTRLTEERGDEAAAQTALTLAEVVHDASHTHQGRAVKWLGDGVMFHFHDPGGAVLAALELVQRVPDEGLPPAHVGIAAGPIIARDGDYFGRTVNAAARIAGYAGPGQVLVTDEVVANSPPHVDFEAIGPVPLKGMSQPLSLHRATHVG